jgi:hypothetical protein
MHLFSQLKDSYDIVDKWLRCFADYRNKYKCNRDIAGMHLDLQTFYPFDNNYKITKAGKQARLQWKLIWQSQYQKES